MQILNAPSYRFAPISSLASLSRALGVSEEELAAVRELAPTSYRRQERAKRGGGIRITYSVSKRLKTVQSRVLHRLLRRVELPDYLLGGRPKKCYLDNVQFHCGAKILFGEDVASFYPSIRRAHVHSIFQNLMRFSPEASECLTELCVYEDAVPQGASTSGDLANLVLWRREPELAAQFASRDLKYSRFVDDVYVSAQRQIAPDDKTWIVSQLHRLLSLEGFRVKRKKHELASSGDCMHVHRVGINAGRPTLPRAERAKIRAAVRQFELMVSNNNSIDARRVAPQLRGRIARLKRIHATEHAQLSSRLRTASDWAEGTR